MFPSMVKKYLLLLAVSLPVFCAFVTAQPTSNDWKERLGQELRTRTAQITPRKIKTRGKPKMARWEDVDATLADAQSKLDIGSLLRELLGPALAPGKAIPAALQAELDQVLSQYPVSYAQLFVVEDPDVLFPLTNNVLRLGSDGTLDGLQIFDKTGFSLGEYAGKYVFEKSGGLSSGASGYRLTYFQYKDNVGEIRPSGNINLLDTFAVRWGLIKDKPGIVLTTAEVLSR